MRFHVLSLPHTQTTREFNVCAYTEKVRKFCMMMRDRGHEVFLYAGEQNEAPCTELITCITEVDRKAAVGDRPYVEATFDWNKPHWLRFNGLATAGILKRAQPKDFICVIAGLAHKPVTDLFPALIPVEFGIGYGGTYAPYRVFESYAWMHTVYGSQAGRNAHDADGRTFDEVIPNYFDIREFPFSNDQGDYYLFVGRLTDRKGFRVAAQVCEHLKAPLILAGPGSYQGYGTHIGVVDSVRRGALMSRAKALFVPTQYVEPFGGVAIEANLCGCPVITTDWGAFTETVKNGRNGWRCRMHKDFIEAAQLAKHMDVESRAYLRQDAQGIYGLDPIAKRYEDYFARVLTMYGGKGYYEL